MKREIKFRGNRVNSNEWVYGHLIIEPNGSHWIDHFPEGVRHTTEVVPDSVGQFTGIKDKYGIYIYEGSIVKYAEKKKLCPKCCEKEFSSDMLYGSKTFCPNCGTPTENIDFITIAEVIYNKAAFGYKHNYKMDGYYQCWPVYANECYLAWVEVIGNIYLNPELLK